MKIRSSKLMRRLKEDKLLIEVTGRDSKTRLVLAPNVELWFERYFAGPDFVWSGVAVAIVREGEHFHIGISRARKNYDPKTHQVIASPAGKSITREMGREIALGRARAALARNNGTEERYFGDTRYSFTLHAAAVAEQLDNYGYNVYDDETGRCIVSIPGYMFAAEDARAAS